MKFFSSAQLIRLKIGLFFCFILEILETPLNRLRHGNDTSRINFFYSIDAWMDLRNTLNGMPILFRSRRSHRGETSKRIKVCAMCVYACVGE